MISPTPGVIWLSQILFLKTDPRRETTLGLEPLCHFAMARRFRPPAFMWTDE